MVSSEVAKKQREFVGRIKAGQGIAKLYVSLEKEHEWWTESMKFAMR